MDNKALQTISETLGKHTEIGVVTGKNPNLDSMAAALSLYLALKSLGKKVTVASPSEPIVEISSLVGIDKLKTSLSSEGGDLIVSFPYREGEIEKVSYTLGDGYLNIVVKAGELGLSFDKKEVKYKRQGVFPTLLFIIGTPRLSDLGNLFDPEALKDTTIINIDNKQENQGFGDITYVSAKFSSLSEMVADALLVLDSVIDVDIAQNLLSGISFATNNYQDSKTSYLAFEMTAQLLKKGAVRLKSVGESRFLGQDTSFFKPRQGTQYNDFKSQAQSSRSFPNQQSQQHQQQRQQSLKRQQFQPNDASRQGGQPHQNQQSQQQLHHQQQPQANKNQQPKDQDDAPADWLTPKVYKSSHIE